MARHIVAARCALTGALLLAAGAACGAGDGMAFRTLLRFQHDTYPQLGGIMDAAGDLIGSEMHSGPTYHGAVFKLTKSGIKTVLHRFRGDVAGEHPVGRMALDPAGNIYGTTKVFPGCGKYCGTVFKLAPDGTKTILHAFHGGSDGVYPRGLVRDAAGNLYGFTDLGGHAAGCDTSSGCGIAFKLAPDGTETILHAFAGNANSGPVFVPLVTPSGAIFGVTTEGGQSGICTGGCGTVFEISADGKFRTFYRFTGGDDGGWPFTSLVQDKAGNLYGLTAVGGAGQAGTIFKISPDGTETTLHATDSQADGYNPGQDVARDEAGNLYGTMTQTFTGAKYGGNGTIFKFSPDGTFTELFAFPQGGYGAFPVDLFRFGNVLYGDAEGQDFPVRKPPSVFSLGE